jgi:Cdc6-like AAA superfamily ATPase
MATSVEGEARKALNRLRRALEKSERELESVVGALRHAEGDDFPRAEYEAAQERIDALVAFVDEEGERLQQKVLQAGGLEPGRIRRSSEGGGR